MMRAAPPGLSRRRPEEGPSLPGSVNLPDGSQTDLVPTPDRIRAIYPMSSGK